MLVRKTEVVPIECVVRGYLSGSGWKEYQQSGTVCGIRCRPGLRESDRLPEPIFTPATKAESGPRQEHLRSSEMAEMRRPRLAESCAAAASTSTAAAPSTPDAGHHPRRHQIRVRPAADGELILIDEVLTPDSSRFWPADQYARARPAVVRQAVRPRLAGNDRLGQEQPAAPLPDDVVARTRAKYIEAYERLAQTTFAWR